jgi:AcrR family transcriptional regulator
MSLTKRYVEDSPTKRSSRSAVETRRVILAVAEREFAGKKFEEISVEHLAAEAEVNIATIYYHFNSKADLYCRLASAAALVHLNLVREEIAQLEPKNRARHVAVSYTLFRDAWPGAVALRDQMWDRDKIVSQAMDVLQLAGVESQHALVVWASLDQALTFGATVDQWLGWYRG